MTFVVSFLVTTTLGCACGLGATLLYDRIRGR